jgi:hypothetical protein
MFSRAAGPGPVNSARYVFLDPGASDFYVDWERAANDVVAVLRQAAGHDPYDRDLSDLVGELSTQSAEFRTRWAAHNVRFHDTGVKEYHHPLVGDLTLTYNRMDLAADPGQMLMIWTAEPGSKSAEALSSSEAGPRRLKSQSWKTPRTVPDSPSSRRWTTSLAGSARDDRGD